nr:hypothetical protein Hi04_10k_c361_00013 [uncultured bacterium]
MDKSALFADRLPEAEVEIPGVGIVRVRGLTRAEVLKVRKATDSENMDGDRALVLERKLLAKAMVDPELTEAEVGQWQEKATPGELEPVIEKVQELSGLLPGSSKSGLH